ncbi:unnamed protein product [Lactuca virosa]|uniref:Uncharacterized protein n=1 Tax=Lactuca virosa TaxID=75947 RepID=A0AAU9MB53_9ASTR|nr:unnamed protein product [Lactuca virosa]
MKLKSVSSSISTQISSNNRIYISSRHEVSRLTIPVHEVSWFQNQLFFRLVLLPCLTPIPEAITDISFSADYPTTLLSTSQSIICSFTGIPLIDIPLMHFCFYLCINL